MSALSPQVAALLPALPWLLPYLSLFRLARKRPSLERVAPVQGPAVSVIIPARNEARTIATVVRSVLATRYARMELLIVDDRSTDATWEAIQTLARSDVRIRPLRGAELPPGWYGKPWACFQGYRAARGELLLFTDADTRHGPELLGRAVAELLDSGADLLTVAPRQRCETFWERVVMPQVWLLLGLRFHPETVNHARHARDVIANGQFILVPRRSYEAAGTHEAVRGAVAEDLALAQRFWRAGLRLRFVFADRLMETRMYRGLRHLIEGWSKNVYLGGRATFPDEPVRRAVAPLIPAAVMLFWLIPAVLLGLHLAGTLAPRWWPATRLASAATFLFWCLITGGMRIPPWYGLGYPLGALMTLFIILRSTMRGARRVVWKGRVYDETVNTGDSGQGTGGQADGQRPTANG